MWALRRGQSLDFRSFQSSVFLSFRPKFQFSLFQSFVLVQIGHLDEISMKIFYPSNKLETLQAWRFGPKFHLFPRDSGKDAVLGHIHALGRHQSGFDSQLMQA